MRSNQRKARKTLPTYLRTCVFTDGARSSCRVEGPVHALQRFMCVPALRSVGIIQLSLPASMKVHAAVTACHYGCAIAVLGKSLCVGAWGGGGGPVSGTHRKIRKAGLTDILTFHFKQKRRLGIPFFAEWVCVMTDGPWAIYACTGACIGTQGRSWALCRIPSACTGCLPRRSCACMMKDVLSVPRMDACTGIEAPSHLYDAPHLDVGC